ncbi:MAG: hypothetical protein R3D98_12485 [Candidatus Krumholzibacteriia bacterium]
MSIHPLRLIATCALVVGLSGAAAAADRTYSERLEFRKLDARSMAATPDGAAKISRELDRQRLFDERWHQVHELLGAQHVSSRSQRWLSERGLGPARLRAPLADAGLKAAADTLHILLVRISFETNREPGLATLSPSGDFFLDPPAVQDTLPIDPAPHDRAFFEAHLEGLRQFYSFQSGGRLVIDARVLPEGDTDSYKLGDIADYGPGAGEFWTLDGLESIVRDMITTADTGAAADGVSLADYDDDNDRTYIIFAHAGSDWQSDINRDSPNDIPTFFVTLGEAQPLTSVDSQTGEPGSLRECSVIPETTTQDGYKGSIAAALYHEFGHALGLPDVYDAYSGYTACGVWDLMDSGTNLAANIGVEQDGEIVSEIVTGLLPPSLSAWCKWFLGWVVTDEVTGGEPREFKLPAVGVPRAQYTLHNQVAGNRFDLRDPQVLLGGASRGEFFLVENRWVPYGVEDTPYDDAGGLYFHRDSPTGVVQYLGGDIGDTGYNTGYYDYFLPDGGLLVWHANMDRIEETLADNTINRFGDGLKVVEADGIQDIGVLDAYVLGWYGSPTDVFAPWNASGYPAVVPDGAGVPNSRAFDRSWTGLHLQGIADDGNARGAIMRLDASLDGQAAGWPLELPVSGLPQDPDPRGLITGSMTAVTWPDGRDLVFAASDTTAGEPALLFAWTAAGEPAFGPVGSLPDGAFMALPGPLVAPPAVIEGAADVGVTFGTTDGTVWQLSAGVGDAPMVGWSLAVDDTLVAGPVPVPLPGVAPEQWPYACIGGGGRVVLVDGAGALLGDSVPVFGPGGGTPSAPMVTLAGGAASRQLLVVMPDAFEVLEIDADGFTGRTERVPARVQGAAQVAAVADAGDTRVILFADQGVVGSWLVSAAGAVARTDWPDLAVPLVGEPAVADLDGDGRLDVVALSAARVHAWQADGTSLTGYPRRLADLAPLGAEQRFTGGPVVANLAAGPANELACLTEAGHLFVLGQDALAITGTPLRCTDGASSLLVVPHDGRLSLAVATAGGLRGRPLDTRLTQGRIVLVGEQDDDARATAGWFGPGGGSARVGTVGTARPVVDDPALAGADLPQVVFYPSPITGRTVTLRFFAAAAGPARLAIYTLEGEAVLKSQFAAEAGRVNEFTLDLDVASGLYVARLEYAAAGGSRATAVRTLAVAR